MQMLFADFSARIHNPIFMIIIIYL